MNQSSTFFRAQRGFAQKRETGFNSWIELKTAYGDATPHFAPAMTLNQLIENGLQGDAVQWIARMGDNVYAA